jgi:uncharacterized protein YggL (DUF469 family)
MFEVKDLNPDYEYHYSIKKSLSGTLSSTPFNKNDPFQMVAFINEFVTANEWEWDSITYYNCKRIEFLIQKKIPSETRNKKSIHKWLIANWDKSAFPLFKVSYE